MIGLLKAIVDLPISMKGNSTLISGNSLSAVGGPEQGFRPCFADVPYLGQITSAMQANLNYVLNENESTCVVCDFFFPN